jgi:sec-independent protein translocase protein TatC
MAKKTVKKSVEVEPDDPQARMSFGEHLEELRKRLIYALLGSSGAIFVCMYYAKEIVFWLAQPYINALTAQGYPATFQFLKPAEPLIMYLTVGFQAGLIVSSPWIIYQIWLFVAAGLYPRERKVVYKFIGPSALLFLAGVAFFYFVVLPLSLNFFVGYTGNTAVAPPSATWIEKILQRGGTTTKPAATQTAATAGAGTQAATLPSGTALVPVLRGNVPVPPEGFGFAYFDEGEGRLKFKTRERTWVYSMTPEGSLFSNNPRMDDYIDFVAFSALVFGLAFEMPMVILVLATIGIVEVGTFRRMRKYAYFGISILSAVAAPSTDIMTMLFLMVPLVLLYEAGIIAAAITVKKREEEVDEDAEVA